MLQEATVDVWINDHIKSLFGTRTRWLSMNGNEMNWEGPNGRLFNRYLTIRTKARVRDVMGMYAHLNKNDPLAPYNGMVDYAQEHRSTHAAGSLNINKVIVARGLGISRTRVRAAPTRMTAAGGVGVAGRT